MRTSGLVLLLLLAIAGSSHAVDLQQFLTDPKYAPFLQKALQTVNCLTDPAVTGGIFDLDQCPSLLDALAQLDAGASDITAECEAPCAATFYTLSPECLDQLTSAFASDTSPVGLTGAEFLAACKNEYEMGGSEDAFSPSLAP